MPQNVQVLNAKDFTGGLNLRANQFSLAPNESPDLMNVDVDPRGGFRLRGGVTPWGPAALAAPIHSMAQFHKVDGTARLVVGVGTSIKSSNGGAFADVANTQTVSDPFNALQWDDNLYVQNGTDQPLKWTGSATSRMAQAFSEDFALPGSGNMPIGRATAVFHSHVFVADTTESGTRFPHRVRYSHPGNAEAWRNQDRTDIDRGVDGDEIVALQAFGDHLLILKRKSVHIALGYGFEDFQFDTITREAGAVSPHAVCSSPMGVYFFAWPIGVMFWDGRSLRPIFERLRPLIEDGTLTDSRMDEIRMGWLNNRLWVSVPVGALDTHTFVYDPSLGKEGSWTRYDLALGAFVEWSPAGGGYAALAAAGATVVKVDRLGVPWDQLTVGGDLGDIASYYVTRWYDVNQPAVKKRWRRPQTVYFIEGSGTVNVAVYGDYNAANRIKSFQEALSSESESMVWDVVASVWDGEDPDDTWAAEGANHKVSRGSSLGSGKAVQLRFDGPHGPVVWGVDSISMPYIPRKVR